MSAGPEAPAQAPMELTGAADPLALSIAPVLDAGASALRLRLTLHNRLTTEARGVSVRCGPQRPGSCCALFYVSL